MIELRGVPAREALIAGGEVLAAIGSAAGRDRDVVLVPGNHDHRLLTAWLERRARFADPPPLGLESEVDWRASELLATVVRALAPATVRVAYPGVWLRADVYATHGHYLDRHTTVPMFERLGAGAMARITREPPGGPHAAEDYEASLAPIYAWLNALAEGHVAGRTRSARSPSSSAWHFLSGSEGHRGPLAQWRRRGAVAALPAVVWGLNRAGLGPLHSDLSGGELRRAALHAFGEVIDRLGVQCEHVVFGHTHRAGPLPADDRDEWRAPTGPALVNAGSWVHEPAFLGERPHESPYRAGFGVVIDDDRPPLLLSHSDRLSEAGGA